jgi:predicted lipoprotein with Yx(FWY)xxD motif
MKRLLIAGGAVAVALIAGIAIAIAATSGGGGGSTGSSDSHASNMRGATVSAEQIAGSGNVLVDSTGTALYANDQEKKGMVLCDGACLSFWTPLTVHGAPKSGSLAGKLGIVTRPDGAKQVTYNGKLLYTFYLDDPGKVGGDGFDDAFGGKQFTWHVVHASGSTSSSGGGQPSNPQPSDTIPGY